jgi:hypothetical protein
MVNSSERRQLESQYGAAAATHGAVAKSIAGLLVIVGMAMLGAEQQIAPVASISASQGASDR